MQNQKNPIAFLSVFKSGTEMMKRVIQDVTGLLPLEPEIIPGKVNYRDSSQLYFQNGCFYTWHLFPTPEVQQKLIETHARPVLLLRNIYDLVVSMYYHFANNIDADIGRGRNVDHYFREMSKKEGLSCIIEGIRKPDFLWKGIGPHLQHMELMLQFSERYPCFVTSYENITQQKSGEVQRLAKFFEIPLNDVQVQSICCNSCFNKMKANADRKILGVSHFRRGRSGAHAEELNMVHIAKIQHAIKSYSPHLTDLLDKTHLAHVLNVVNSAIEL